MGRAPLSDQVVMDVEIPCIACQAVLRVPSNAAGHRLRCPSCKAVFVMPSSQKMMEETVSGWIEHDVEEVFENRQKHTDDIQTEMMRMAAENGALTPEVMQSFLENQSKQKQGICSYWKISY